MKNILLALSIFVTGLSAHSQSKVGTIDAEYILAQMPEVAAVDEALKTYNTNLQEDMKANIAKYEELVANYQANKSTFTEEELSNKESEIISIENDIKNFRQKATLLIQVKRNELTEPLYLKIDEAMKVIIAEEEYTQIFNTSVNGMAYSDPKYDITDAVMEKLGIEIPKE